VLTLIFAGSDTTASVLTSVVFLEISSNSTLESNLRESCTSDDPSRATELVKAVLLETQRAHPAAPFTMRVVDEEDLEVGGYRVPKGWLVAYALAGTLLGDDETYQSPNTFNAERWLRDNALPVWAFGGGKRMCPGKALSIGESIIMLTHVLVGSNGFQWRLEPDQDLFYRYTPGFFPDDGLKVRLE
jgi:cytochrome P450